MGVVVPRVEDAVYLSALLRFSELKLFHMFTFHPTFAPHVLSCILNGGFMSSVLILKYFFKDFRYIRQADSNALRPSQSFQI